jgi:hypothetical protein
MMRERYRPIAPGASVLWHRRRPEIRALAVLIFWKRDDEILRGRPPRGR